MPTFHIGGWYDCFVGETLKQYEAMKSFRERGTRPPRLLVGPWTHGNFESTQGDLDFGIGAPKLDYGGDLTDAHLRWFDATLKGEEDALARHAPRKGVRHGGEPLARLRGVAAPGSREEEWF